MNHEDLERVGSLNTNGNRTAKTIIYGPVVSRRFGQSLGINLSGPGKYCSFNCIYCFRGFNENSPESYSGFPDTKHAISDIDAYMKANPHKLGMLDYITIAGNGEPTDNPDLPDIIDYLFELRNNTTSLQHVKLSLLTNGMGFVPEVNPHYKKLLSRIHKIDMPCVKLDSGNPDTWMSINAPSRDIGFGRWFESMRAIPDPCIQTMLINGKADNTTEDEVNTLAECYSVLKPRLVYLITINKPPADRSITPVPADRMREIRDILNKTAPISTII